MQDTPDTPAWFAAGPAYPPDGSIGAVSHAGLTKLMEECGEVIQIGAKLLSFPTGEYPNGTDLVEEIQKEIGDLRAAISFFTGVNDMNELFISERFDMKLERFHRWHRQIINSRKEMKS